MKNYPYSKDEFSGKVFIDTQVILQNELAMIIAPQHAFVPGYVMLAPMQQAANFEKISPDELLAISRLAGLLDIAYGIAFLDYAGYTTLVNRGVAAGQHVPHVHLHFFPHMSSERTHPLYQQLKPSEYGLTDPGLEVRLWQTREILAKAPENVEYKTDSVVHFSSTPGLIAEHVMLTTQSVECFQQIGREGATSLLSAITAEFCKAEKSNSAVDGYNLIIPQKQYRHTSLVGLQIDMIMRSEEEFRNPLKLMPLNKRGASL